MHIEKKSLVSKRAAAATIIAINSRRVDLSKPAPAPRPATPSSSRAATGHPPGWPVHDS
jgi:hypothetical protein